MRICFFGGMFCSVLTLFSQQAIDLGSLHGNIGIDAQYYAQDSVISATVPNEKIASNSFVNLNYKRGILVAGLRYEAYLPVLQGFPQGFDGAGVPYLYAGIHTEELDVNLGNFYGQFGSGILFRAYEERGLGYDNAMDGAMIKSRHIKGVSLTAMIGKQRKYFDKSAGTVRGLDLEWSLNESFDSLKTRISLGGSFISKFQSDNSSVYNLPENVAASSFRATIAGSKFRFFNEWAYKINDPSAQNNFIYKNGTGFISQFSYFTKGFGFSADVKRIDNMSFRSEREALLTDVMINFSPSFTRQHTYNLLATLYPYATQLNGEIGGQFELSYKFKKASTLGGKYGTKILLNASQYYGLDTMLLNDQNTDRLGYQADLFGTGELYFRDIHLEVSKKFSKKVKGIFTLANLAYQKDVLEGKSGYGLVKSWVWVNDLSIKLKPKHTLRIEAQGLFTKQDLGDWVTLLVEYTLSPHWFFAIMDQYNYSNPAPSKRTHYYFSSIGYNKNAHRISLSYGRQRAGIFCVGGVCRNVPAANGFTLNLTSNF